jgi:hypothetical protein
MTNKKLNLIIFTAIILAMFAACEKISENQDDDDDDDNTDVYTFDTTTVVQITLNSTSITVVPEVATVNGSKITITSAGTYKVSGSLTDGQIIVDSENKGNVRLILNGVNIKCSNSAPVYIKDSDKTLLNLADGTVNYLTDGTSYVTENGEPSAALFSNSDLTIYGEGSLTVAGNYADGISSDDGVLIKSGTISVTSADDGIRGKDYLHIENGNITVNSKGDALKSDNDTDTSLGYISVDYGTFNLTASSGDAIDAATNVLITDGIFTIITGGGAGTSSSSTGSMPGGGGGTSGGYTGTISEKALKGGTSVKIDKGTFTINAADDALHSNGNIIINNGTINAATGDDGVHGETSIIFNGGTLNISKCYEGIEGPSITVNGGNIIMACTDDGFNATKGSATESNDGSYLYIKGGYIVVNASTGDAFDSNGSIDMSAGTVILHGPKSSPEVAFDVNGSFTISGGYLIASGPNSGNMIETPASSSSQYCIKATTSSTLSSSTLFHLEDASGNDIATFKPVRSVYYLVISSPKLTSGASYSIYTGGSSTGTESNGLYSGGSYSGGTLKKTFPVTSKITSVSF